MVKCGCVLSKLFSSRQGLILTSFFVLIALPGYASESKNVRPKENTTAQKRIIADIKVHAPAESLRVHYEIQNKRIADNEKDIILKRHSFAANETLPLWLTSLNDGGIENLKKEITEQDNRSLPFISKMINSHNAEIQNCYSNYLKINPNLIGKVVVRIFINSLGNVANVEIIESNISLENLEKEILEKIMAWNNFGISANSDTQVYRQEYIFGE